MATKTKAPPGIKIIAQNRKARHDYEIIDTYEAGLVLKGTEIKSMRLNGRVNIQRGFVHDRDGELWIVGINIAEFEGGNRANHEPERPRKLLLHKREIIKIRQELKTKGYTAIPLKLYLKKGRAKLEIALGRGKKNYDKRKDIAKKDAKRDMDRQMKGRY